MTLVELFRTLALYGSEKRDMIASLASRLDKLRSELSERDGLRSRFAKGVAWSFIGNAFGQIAKLIGSVILARLLGQVGFGELGVVISTVGLFGVFAGMGLGTTATKYVADLRDRAPEQAGRVIGFLVRIGWITGALVSIIVFCLAPLISSEILRSPLLAQSLRIGSLLLLLNVLNGVQIGTLAGLESFSAIAVLSAIEGVLGLLFSSVGAWAFGLSGAIGGYVCGAVILYLIGQLLLVRGCCNRNILISYRQGREEWAILWNFGLPALLVLASIQPFIWGARVVLANQPNGYAQLGLLNAAFNWGAVLLFLPRQISKPALPILANLHSRSSSRGFASLFGINFLLAQGSAILIAIPILLLSPVIMRSYGPSFVDGTSAMVIMVVANTISAGTLSFRDAIASSGRMWIQFFHSIIWGITLIVFSIAFSGWGALGISLAFLLSYSVLFSIQLSYLFSSKLLYFPLTSEPAVGKRN